jgi:hypothetical protein
MLRRAATTAMILLVSTCLLPPASIAIDGTKSIEIGHLGDRFEATVEISSVEGRMSAIPLVRVKEDPERAGTAAADGAEFGKKTIAKIVPDGDISLSRGLKILDQAREAIKKWKTEKAESRSAALAGMPASRDGAKAAEDTKVADDEADSGSQTIRLCDNCNFRLVTNTSFQ